MIIIAFSDVHGNSDALEVFLNEIKHEKYDKIVFCGDIFGYYYNQIKVINLLQGIKDLLWIKGNHDDYFLKLYEGKMNEESCIKRFGHSYDKGNEIYNNQVYNLIRKLSSHIVIYDNVNDIKIGVYHGSPYDELEDRVYPDTAIVNEKKYNDYGIVILGHTHCRMKRYVGNTLVVNPGSVGQPRDGLGFCYAKIDTTSMNVKFKTFNVDTTKLYKQIDVYDKNLTKLKAVLERGAK